MICDAPVRQLPNRSVFLLQIPAPCIISQTCTPNCHPDKHKRTCTLSSFAARQQRPPAFVPQATLQGSTPHVPALSKQTGAATTTKRQQLPQLKGSRNHPPAR